MNPRKTFKVYRMVSPTLDGWTAIRIDGQQEPYAYFSPTAREEDKAAYCELLSRGAVQTHE